MDDDGCQHYSDWSYNTWWTVYGWMNTWMDVWYLDGMGGWYDMDYHKDYWTDDGSKSGWRLRLHGLVSILAFD